MNIQPSDRLQKLGTYAFKEIKDRVQALRDQGITPIDFGVGDPSEPTPDFVRETLKVAADQHATTGYPSYTGSAAFLEAAARYMQRRFGVELDPATEISSNIGSKEAIFHFPEAVINPGDTVLVPSPGYPPMKTGTIFAEGEPYYVPLLAKNNFLIDYAAIPEDVCKRAKILWLNYPNSPTGVIAGREYYEGLVAWAKQYEIILAADEGCYIDIYFDEKPISILEVAREGIITFYSLSKRNNMTGYRVGFVAGDRVLVDLFKKLKTNIDSGTPNFVQEAAIAALDNEDHCREMSKLYREKGAILMEALKKMGLEVRPPQATFFLWQKVPDGMTDIDFAKKLLEPEIAIVVTPGSSLTEECAAEFVGGGGQNGEVYGRKSLLDDTAGIVPGARYVRFALMPSLGEMREAAERLSRLKF